MFLKSVEIFGFKSFADRSRIEFQDGISALLGPNGCGKSNVVDSIKWVLGEQATKSLRAEKMEDVIFNGTENRKPLNVAEVTLTLSNDEGLLPIDMPEISIKRRLYRSGESEYQLNNTPVRLRELRELFFDTGIGKSAYSIMEQGKIDQILSNRPEERRYIFEEAAGITKFKVRRGEAERKLERTEENMRQVDGILNEVRRSHDALKKQSEKTVTYRKLKDEIFEMELDIQLLKLKGFLESKEGKEARLKDRASVRDQLKGEIEAITGSLEENMDQVNDMESRLIESQKKLYGIDLEKNNKDSQLSLLEERQHELDQQIMACLNRENGIKDKISLINAQIADKETILAEFDGRLEEINENIATFENNIEISNSRIEANEDEILQKDREIREAENLQADLSEELQSLTDDIVTQLDARLRETGYNFRERQNVEAEIRSSLKSIEIQLSGRLNLIEDAISLDSLSKSDREELLTRIRKSLVDSQDIIRNLGELFEKYNSVTPSFLDEFLAPEGIITRKREIDEKIVEIRNGIQNRREHNQQLREENRTLAARIEEYRGTLEDLRVNKVRMRTQRTAMEESMNLLRKDIEEQRSLSEENAKEMEACEQNLRLLRSKVDDTRAERKALEEEESKLKKELAALESSISKRNKDLHSKEQKLKEFRENLARIQTQVERLQIDVASLDTEIRNLYENFREQHSRELTEFESRMFDIGESPKELREFLADARDALKKLGHVNLMAPEEYAEVKERYDFLNNQLEDLTRAREDLKIITEQIKTESTELFLTTYDQIRKNFHMMFRRLFGGGRAELKLLDPDNVLESGIEIYAQPPGKKLENIALLSGGERSLTGVGLLFATYMVKPSPFCILDEIDAALDEHNVGRFVNLLSEFGESSQFIVITHNKKTVTGAKTLLGVTMEESGVSKVIAIRLEGETPAPEEERPEPEPDLPDENEIGQPEMIVADTE